MVGQAPPSANSPRSFSALLEPTRPTPPMAAMVDRLIHYAEVFVLKGRFLRAQGKGKEVIAAEDTR